MGDSGLPEFKILWVLLGCPVYLPAMVLQASYLRRRRISWSQRRTLLIVVGTVASACVLGAALREGLPPELMGWRGNSGDWPYMFLGVFFIPALLATAAIFPAFTWAALRSTRPTTHLKDDPGAHQRL